MEPCDQPKSRIGRLEVETQLPRLGYRGTLFALVMPRYRISTLLLTITILVICTAWYFDRSPPLRSRLIGVWHHPIHGIGRVETITFYADGRFDRNFGSNRYIGTYVVNDSDIVSFAFLERSVAGGMRRLTEEERRLADCRAKCVIDDDGDLLIVNLNPEIAYEYQIPKNECYIPSRDYIREAEYKARNKRYNQRVLQMLEDSFNDTSKAGSGK